jgi:hypothetical protein
MASVPRMAPASPATQVLPEFCSDVVVGLSQSGQKELPSNTSTMKWARRSLM